MKFIKSIIALAAAALGSATPVAHHAVTSIANYTAINITSHAGTNMTKAALSYPSCTLWETWIHWEYDIWVANVDDIAGRCKGLWDNLPPFDCATHYHSYCGGIQESRLLQWHFWTTDLCGISNVENSYKLAMGDMYGEIECVKAP